MSVVPLLVILTTCGERSAAPFLAHAEVSQPESLDVTPQGVTLTPGESLRFVVTPQPPGTTLVNPIRWSARGGQVTQEGLFQAGEQVGTYEVRAELESDKRTLLGLSTGLIAFPVIPNDESESPADIPQQPSDKIFEDGFETSDFRHWGTWAPLGDPTANGKGGGGAHIGEGYITNEMVHTGSYSWRAQVDPATPQPSSWPVGKSSLERWRITQGERDFTVSAWYYFPSDYPFGVWSNIMQIKQGGPIENDPPAVIGINRDRKLILNEGLTDKTVVISSTVMPVGRWVQLESRFVIDRANGRVTTWLDGELVFDVSGINTLGHRSTTNVYFGVGNYLTDKTATRCHVYIDDVKVTRQ